MTAPTPPLLLGLILGGAGALSCAEPAAPAAAETAHAQVSVFWGGGEPRHWNGGLRLGPDARVDWLWLTDFEEGDLCLPGSELPVPDQGVPPGWRPAKPDDFTGPRVVPARGARVATQTGGEADGLCFDLRGSTGTQIVLAFAGTPRLETTLGELLQAPVVVPADGAGNVLFAQAADLDAEAPFSVDHFGTPAHRVSLHTHSCFSTNEAVLEPVVESLRPFARTAWWTDHNLGNDRFVLGGDFEDKDLVRKWWRMRAHEADVRWAGVDLDAASGDGSYLLEGRGSAPHGGRVTIDLGKGAGQLNSPLGLDPVLRWSWKPHPEDDGAASVAFVTVELSSGRVVRYLSGEPPKRGPNDVVLAAAAGAWTSVERRVADDVVALFGDPGTDALRRAAFGVLCPAGSLAGVRFDDVELDVPPPPEVIGFQEELLAGFDDFRFHMGMEQTAWIGPEGFGVFYPHLTALVPGGAIGRFPGLDAPPTAADRAAFARAIEEAGGCVGVHHLNVDEHYEDFLDAGGLGVDLFEVGGAWWHVPAYATAAERAARDACGYPAESEDEVYPLLVRWDRMTARGLFLTGYGAPDLHGRFHRSVEGWLNRWLTWIHAEDDAPGALLAALRAGQATASEWRSGAIVTLAVDGKPWMGKLVATNRGEHTVTARVSHAIPGSRLRWIRGELARGTAADAGTEPGPVGVAGEERLDAVELETSLTVDAARGVFLRAELLNPAGHLVAFTNPVVLVPYRPAGVPEAKLALAWDGDAPPEADARALPKRKERLLAVDVGRVPPERWGLDGFASFHRGPLLLGPLEGSYGVVARTPVTFRLPVPVGERVWLKLRTHGLSRAAGTVSMDGVELGAFERMSALTFPIEPARPGEDGEEERTFTLALDPAGPKPTQLDRLLLTRIELWRGDGVVDY